MDFTFLKNTIEDSFMSADKLNYSTTGDGRLTSAESEVAVCEHFKLLFEDTEVEVIEAPAARHWYDIMLKYKGEVYPINIKITSGHSADNVSSKVGMFYALTGMWPEGMTQLNRWDRYNTLLTENLNPSATSDYYFVIYFKEEEIFLFTSLKRLQVLVANGNNLPFQCNWSDNCELTTRSPEEQVQYIMEVYYTSWVKKTGGFEPLIKWKENNK